MSNLESATTGEPDLADKIALFLEVANNRYHELRDDPTIAGIIERSNEAYEHLKRANSFTDANRIATAQAIQKIINGKLCFEEAIGQDALRQ